jgi:hypothetical protein
VSDKAVAADRAPRFGTTAALLVALLLTGIAAITGQSFWIDEAHSALKACQGSLGAWCAAMVRDGGSDLQMPFYMFYLWAWAKLFGTSEIALRAANIPWFVVGAVALLDCARKDRTLQLSILVLAVTNAFLWYYLSEARPYIVLFAFSSITLACLCRFRAQEPNAISPVRFRFFCAGIVGSCASSLVAVPWAIGAILAIAVLLGLSEARQLLWRFRYISVFTAASLLALAAYYVWTIQLGAGASNVGSTTLGSIAFAFYELSGLVGLGPGRLALRAHQFAACKPYLPILILGAALTAILALSSWSRVKPTRRDWLFWEIAAGIPFLAVAMAGYAGQIRLLGRHFTPLLPFILAFLAIGLNRLLLSGLTGRLIAAVTLLLYLTSALQIRFAPRHQRDDYRDAAAEAKEAIRTGKTVWWAADTQTAFYYGLSPKLPGLSLAPAARPLQRLSPPDLVYLSKPDIYDADGRITSYLREHNFIAAREIQAFQIFEKAPGSPAKE